MCTCKCSHLIFEKEVQNTLEKRHHVQQMVLENWMPTCRMKVGQYLSSGTKIKFMWIEDLNLKQKTVKLVEKKISYTLQDIGI